MSRLIPASERITRAYAQIQKARDLPAPPTTGGIDFSYVAEVMDLLHQARDLVKFIPYTPSATAEIKTEVTKINREADLAEKEILHR